MSKKSLSSPITTGGEGIDFETSIGAYYLSLLLLRTIPRGIDSGLTKAVKFQRLYEGEPLDDLIIYAELPNGEAKLALQAKRDLVFGKENKLFNEVLEACWNTFCSNKFNQGVDRFGIALALYSKTIDEGYQPVLKWAGTSSNSNDFLSRIESRLSNKTMRSFVSLVRTKLDTFASNSSVVF